MGNKDFFPHQTKTLLTQQTVYEYMQPVFREIQACVYGCIHPTLPLTPFYHHRHFTPTNRLERARPDYSPTPSESQVAIATASHTHMCGIRGQGSWVVLDGLNGALCVIIQTSSNPRLRKVMQETASSESLRLGFSFSTLRDDAYDQIMLLHL